MNVAVSKPESGGFLAAYDARRAALGGDLAVRDEAAGMLRSIGLPTRRLEAWKYTDLRPLTGLAIATGPHAVSPEQSQALLDRLGLDAAGLADAPRLVFVNGSLEPRLSRPVGAIEIETGAPGHSFDANAAGGMLALNAMFAEDGARITVRAGIDAGRLLLISLGHGPAETEAREAVCAHPHFTVTLEDGARLSLLEIAQGSGLYVNNPVLDIAVADRAHLTHVLLQNEAPEALHFSTVRAQVGAGGSYDSFSLALGARLARHEVHARMLGAGGEVQVNGAQLLDGSQHADLTSVIAHDAPRCNSRQTVKNVLSGKSRAVFQGKIVVARIAQKTDGYQMNQALLLSDTAEIDSKPELEIYADDVKCSHGATAGALDEDQLFYLRSRGIPADAARAILVRAFLADAITLIDDGTVRAFLDRAVDQSWDRPIVGQANLGQANLQQEPRT